MFGKSRRFHEARQGQNVLMYNEWGMQFHRLAWQQKGVETCRDAYFSCRNTEVELNHESEQPWNSPYKYVIEPVAIVNNKSVAVPFDHHVIVYHKQYSNVQVSICNER